MNGSEQDKTGLRRGGNKQESETPESNDAISREMRGSPAVPLKVASIGSVEGDGPRFWALPDKNLGWWILREDDSGGADGLTSGVPSIFIPELSAEQKSTVGERCRQFIGARLRDRWQEDLYNLVKRLLLGGMLTLAGLFGLRLIEYFDLPLLLGALCYTAYAGIRYGGRFMRSMERASRPFSKFVGEPFVVSPLAQRIASALEVRRALPPENRGTLPDAELLDANAYRKLIREGVVSREQLCALGRAVEKRLDVKPDEPRRLSDVSRTEGLHSESAALYRDLALASAEIAFDSEFN